MILGTEINNFFSRLFSSENSNQNQSYRTSAQADYRLPLMQVVEKKLSQKSVAGTREFEQKPFTAASRIALASEVGPPPLTPATW